MMKVEGGVLQIPKNKGQNSGKQIHRKKCKKAQQKKKNSTAGLKASTLNWRLPAAIISADAVDPTPHGAPFHVSTTAYGPETETEARVHGLAPSPINNGLTETKQKK